MNQVCVYAICRNEERFVDRFMDSASRADTVAVLDTGSDDNTVERLRKRGAIVAEQDIKPWRFDAARNAAMALCPRDAVLLSLDLDEVIAEPDWPERLRENWNGANRGRYTYVWDHRPDGTPGHRFIYDKLHSPDFEWYLPCHELLRPRNNHVEERWSDIPITVHHYPDGSKSRSGYLPLLAKGADAHPDNDRLAHYYGRELFFHSRWEEAIVQLERHVHMPQATWADERCASMMLLARCHAQAGRNAEAESWHMRACGEAPRLREPWLEAARFYLACNRFPMAFAMAKRALQIQQRTDSYIVRAESWAEAPYDVIATASFYLGFRNEALTTARKAAELAPWDERIKQNLEAVERITPDSSKRVEVPGVIPEQAWTADPGFGLVISTYGAEPYVHLSLAVRARHYSEVPALVVDDGSERAAELARLAKRHGADFRGNPETMNHTRGELLAICHGLRWARRRGLDVLVKMSRRFVPRVDWRPGLREAVRKTQHATYAGAFDATYGLRSECIAFEVERWLPRVARLETLARESSWLWVEDVLHQTAREILPWRTGEQDGFALWDFPGPGKWTECDSHLWHHTASAEDYAATARKYNLPYTEIDFEL